MLPLPLLYFFVLFLRDLLFLMQFSRCSARAFTALKNIRCKLLRNIVSFAYFSFSQKKNKWWAQVDSNHRPRAYQARALTS